MPTAQACELTCHPRTPAGAVRRVGVRVCRVGRGVLDCGFVVEGELERLCIPERAEPPAEPRVVHGLWEHTCCEVFVARQGGGAAYHELDLSPAGEWSGYSFAAYRERVAIVAGAHAPRITVRRAAGRLELEARIDLAGIAADLVGAPLRLGLCAVIEETGRGLSYWSLHHPPGKPDFHRPESFALRLEAPGVE